MDESLSLLLTHAAMRLQSGNFLKTCKPGHRSLKAKVSMPIMICCAMANGMLDQTLVWTLWVVEAISNYCSILSTNKVGSTTLLAIVWTNMPSVLQKQHLQVHLLRLPHFQKHKMAISLMA